MQVIVTANLPWRCHEYGLPFQLGSIWFVLRGNRSYGTWIEPLSKIPTELRKTLGKVTFVELSTGDDMHEDARRVFDELTPKLRKLIVMV